MSGTETSNRPMPGARSSLRRISFGLCFAAGLISVPRTFCLFLVRQINGERAPFVHAAFDLDVPEVGIHDLLGDGQAEAGPADLVPLLRFGPEKIVEKPRQVG